MKEIRLSKGSHPSRQDVHGNWTVCAMEFGAYLAGLKHSDRPECVSPALLSLMIGLNDAMPDEMRQRLRPYIVRTLGTRGDGQDARRAYMAADWAVRVVAPLALDAVGLTHQASILRSLPEVLDRDTAHAAAGAADAAAAGAAAAHAAADAADAGANAAAAARAAYAAVYAAAAAAARAAYAAVYAAGANAAGANAAAAARAAYAAVWQSALELLDRIIDPGGLHDAKTEEAWLAKGNLERSNA